MKAIINIIFPLLGAAGAGIFEISKEFGALVGLGLNAGISVLNKKKPKLDSLPENLKTYAYLYLVENELN
jgi:hypothetical protein